MEARFSAETSQGPFSAGTAQRVYGAESSLGLWSRLSGRRFETGCEGTRRESGRC